MIDLNTATAQEVFDFIVAHLRQQNAKSQTEENDDGIQDCLYRYKGLKCAAGCLIPDEKYDVGMEGKAWMGVVSDYKIASNHGDLITSLQATHDRVLIEDWESSFLDTAIQYNVIYRAP